VLNAEPTPDPVAFIKVPANLIPMGSRQKIKFALQLAWVADLLPEIDPKVPHASNRVVEPKHGLEFAEYVVENKDNWIEPGVLLVSQRSLDFRPLYKQPLPKYYKAKDTPCSIVGDLYLDINQTMYVLLWMEGQHRKFGISEKFKQLNKEAIELETSLAANPDDESLKIKVDNNQLLRDRFYVETIDVTIITPVDPLTQQKWFVTIAKESKGIIRAEKERMDEESITVVAAKHVIDIHPVLAGSYTQIIKGESETISKVLNRVNRVPKSSPAIFTLPNITDVTKNIGFSWAKRATIKKESLQLQESIEKMTINFFDDLVEGIDDYKNLTVDTGFTGKELRKKTLFSSATFIRVLADVYHRIALSKSESTSTSLDKDLLEIDLAGRKLFKKLLVNLTPYMDYVDRPDPDEPTKTIRGVHDKWMATGLFRESAKVPDSDTQGLGGLSDLLVEWANNGKVFDPQTVDQIPSKSKGLI